MRETTPVTSAGIVTAVTRLRDAVDTATWSVTVSPSAAAASRDGNGVGAES
jgi:hypothetical protein